MNRLGRWARSVAVLGVASLAACHASSSGSTADSGTEDDGEADVTTSGGEGGGSGGFQGEPPADVAVPDAEPEVPAACLESDAGIAPYASRAGGTVVGTGLSASVCTAVDAYVSSYIAPANRLLLEVTGPVSATFASPSGATQGSLSVLVSIGTSAPAAYTSAESESCGFVAFTYAAGSSTPTYEATAASNCLDPQAAAGSWTVTLTSLVPYGGDAGATYYEAHGTVVATLPSVDGDAGDGAASVTLTF